MTCSKCGKTNKPNDLYCAFCNTPLETKVEMDITEIEDYASNRGFSKPSTAYTKPEVIDPSNDMKTGLSEKHQKQQSNIKKEFYEVLYQELKSDKRQEVNRDTRQKVNRDTPQEEYQNKRQEIHRNTHQEINRNTHQEVDRNIRQELNRDTHQEEYLDVHQETNQNQSIQNNQHNNSHKKKKYISLLLALFASILVFAVLLMVLMDFQEKENDKVNENVIEAFADDVDRITYIFNSKGDLLNKINDYTFPVYNQDHTAAILNDINSAGNSYGSNFLYYASATNLVKLTNMKSFVLSEDGMHVLYSTNGGLNREFLYEYHVKNDQEELIEKLENKKYAALTISREGERISYATLIPDNSINDFKLRELESYTAKTGEKPKPWGSYNLILATSEDQNCVYYADLVEGVLSLYVKQGERVTKLSDNFGTIVFFNRDYSEILYTDKDGTYISINGQEKRKISDAFVKSILMPQNKFMPVQSMGGIYSYDIETFQNKVIYCEDKSLRRIGHDYRSKELGFTAASQYAILSENGNNLVYRNQGMELWRVNELDGICKPELIVDWAYEFDVSNDVSEVYYMKSVSLFYKKGMEKEIKLAEGVTDFCTNRAGDTIFFLKDVEDGSGTLYYSSNGEQPQPVKGAGAVTDLAKWNAGVIYETLKDGVYSVYYNMEGTEFKFILDGVDMIK